MGWSWEASGALWAAPGVSWDAPGAPWGAPWASVGRSKIDPKIDPKLDPKTSRIATEKNRSGATPVVVSELSQSATWEGEGKKVAGCYEAAGGVRGD